MIFDLAVGLLELSFWLIEIVVTVSTRVPGRESGEESDDARASDPTSRMWDRDLDGF